MNVSVSSSFANSTLHPRSFIPEKPGFLICFVLSPLSGVGRCRFVFVHGVTDGLQECVHKILKLNIAEGQEKEAKFRVIRVIVFVY
jgi:hypothetical protein